MTFFFFFKFQNLPGIYRICTVYLVNHIGVLMHPGSKLVLISSHSCLKWVRQLGSSAMM